MSVKMQIAIVVLILLIMTIASSIAIEHMNYVRRVPVIGLTNVDRAELDLTQGYFNACRQDYSDKICAVWAYEQAQGDLR